MNPFVRDEIAKTKPNRSQILRRTCHNFFQALLSPPEPSKLIEQFFTPHSPKITEHGPQWCRERLPFLSKTFIGASGPDSCETYFQVLSETLKMHMSNDTFPGPDGFIVDTSTMIGGEEGRGAVSVVGKARFESVKTGKSWDEQFIYRLSGFDDFGRIGHWEIWADPLSAWDALNDN